MSVLDPELRALAHLGEGQFGKENGKNKNTIINHGVRMKSGE